MAIILDDDEVTFDDVCGNVAIDGRAVEGNCGHEPINRQGTNKRRHQSNNKTYLFFFSIFGVDRLNF